MAPDPTIRMRDPAVRALAREMVDAGDPQIMRIVAMVDAMASRGAADTLIAPLRQRLTTLRPLRPLRFGRLMFQPLDPLIVPAARWRPGQQAIPRTALPAMAEQVRLAMGADATRIVADLDGHTTADADLIARLGGTVWPAAARILGGTEQPASWNETGLGDANYRPLAELVASLLGQAVALEALHAGVANGLLPLRPEPVTEILADYVTANKDARPGPGLAMMMTLILHMLPESAGFLAHARTGPEGAAARAAMDQAADAVLRQLHEDEGTEASIAAGSLLEAGAAVRRIATFLTHLDAAAAKPGRREQLRDVRHRLDVSCKARFASGLQDELLAPLQHPGVAISPEQVPALETAARGLRVLALEGRAIGSGGAYDLLLGKATDAIRGRAMRDRLSPVDQVRLVEILAGPDAAFALLDPP
jgi:hypothetical protein